MLDSFMSMVTEARVTRKEETSAEKMSPKDGAVGKLAGIFFISV